jgi:hypothetical protein
MARETQPDQNGHASEAELAGLREGLTQQVALVFPVVLGSPLTIA